MTRPEIPRILTVSRFGSDELRARQRVGAAQLLRRGAYREPSTKVTPWDRDEEELLARCAAVAERLTTPFAFADETAARIYGWPAEFDPRRVSIVQAVNPNRCGSTDIRRRVLPDLRPSDIVEINGLPVLSPMQTMADCARNLKPLDALITVDAAFEELAEVDVFKYSSSLARQREVRNELQSRLDAIGRGRHIVRARSIARYANGFSGSPQESTLRWIALVVGMPEPTCQWEQWIQGCQYFSDLAWLATADDWPRRAVTFEYDGEDKYGPDRHRNLLTFAAEKDRQDAISSTDVDVHRVTKGRLSNHNRTAHWMLSKFPPSVRASLEPRPALQNPIPRPRPRRA